MAFGATEPCRRDPGALEPSSGNPPCFILIVPLFHVTGCVPVMLSCFSVQLKLVMMHRWDPEKALSSSSADTGDRLRRGAHPELGPARVPHFHKYDTSSLATDRRRRRAGAAQAGRRVEGSSKGRPSIGYGMTETNAFGPGNSGDDYVSTRRRPGGRGPPSSTSRSATTRGAGRPGRARRDLDEGTEPHPRLLEQARGDGRDHRRRLAAQRRHRRIDDEGFLYVEDRAKDMVLRAGENVYCAEVEAAIYEHPAVYEAAVFGVPDERLGEEVVIQLKPDSDLSVDELKDFLAERLAPFKIPSRIAFTGERLPRNPSGKILKRELRERFFTER
jgi:long-chain acyl-CoA synthetase